MRRPRDRQIRGLIATVWKRSVSLAVLNVLTLQHYARKSDTQTSAVAGTSSDIQAAKAALVCSTAQVSWPSSVKRTAFWCNTIESECESPRRRCHRVHRFTPVIYQEALAWFHECLVISLNLESICGCPRFFFSSLLHITSTSTYSSRIFCHLFSPAFGRTIWQKKQFFVSYLISWRQYVVETLLFVCCFRYCRMSITVFCANVWNCHGPVFFRSYLHSRSQYVHCGMHGSSSVQLICRVPQCLVLGSVLFIMYTADLTTFIEQHIQCESKKVAPPKTFCDIFTYGEHV